MKKGIAIAVSAVLAVVVAVFCIICLTRIKVGYVGVVYSAKGVEQNTLTQGWHWLSPLKHVKQFPVVSSRLFFPTIHLTTTQTNMQIGILMPLPTAAWWALT